MIITVIKGINFTEIFSTLTFDMVEEINRLHPYGGVEKPIARPILMIIPNCIGSIPSSLTIGRNIGVRIIVDEILSTKQPMIRSTALIRSNTIILLCAKPNIKVPTFIGILSIARYDANDVASPTIKSVAPITIDRKSTRLNSSH